MWNPFSTREKTTNSEPAATADSAAAAEAASTLRSGIAEVELMGHIVVATLTVTELSQEQGAEQLAELPRSDVVALHDGRYYAEPGDGEQ